MREKGIEVHTACYGNFDSEFHHEIPSLSRSINIIKDIKAIYEVCRILKKIKPSIIHTHTPKAGLIGITAGWLCRVPVRMHTVAGLPLMEKTGLWQKILILIERFIYLLATSIHPNSKGLKTFIEKEVSSSNKISIIGNGTSNGINLSEFNSSRVERHKLDQLKTKLAERQSETKFCFIGRLVSDKGVNEMVEAFIVHNKKHPKSVLLLVGPMESELDPLLASTLNAIKNHDSIFEFGFQKDVRPYIEISDVLVFPSYREGFPNVPMQFAAFKKPMILSDINGCNELVTDGENGILVNVKEVAPLVEAMGFLQGNVEIRNKMGQKAFDFVASNFQQAVVWNAILETYKSELERLN